MTKPARKSPTIIDTIEDENLFARWFRDPVTWVAWRAFLKVLFGLPAIQTEQELYTACTGRSAPPQDPINEAWLVCGRRAGKSFVIALIAVYLAVFRSWTHCLSPGERGTIMIVACDRKQSRVIMRYVRALLEEVPLLAPLIERQGAEEIDLTNRITIEIHTASFRTVRGYTLVAALCDEIAFWRSEESSDPDTEILAALRPGLATTGGMLLCASSPYARRGALWTAHRQHYGRDSSVLVWKAPTRTMNPSVPQSIIDAAIDADPAAAAAEYLAEFRTDVETFVSREVVDAAVVPGRHELPYIAGTKYFAFVDPSGGSQDSMTLAICHRENDRVVLDAIRERRPPFSPDTVVEEFAALMKGYSVGTVRGDRYAGEWPRERFKVHGITYLPADMNKSEIYGALLPVLNSGQAELLDHPRMIAQLCALERRTARGGKDSIDHPPSTHDDIANSMAGAVVLAAKPKKLVPFAAPIVCRVPIRDSVDGSPLRKEM